MRNQFENRKKSEGETFVSRLVQILFGLLSAIFFIFDSSFIVVTPVFFIFSPSAPAAQLEPLSVFKRCYGQMTQSRLAKNDPKVDQLVSDLSAGKITAVEACIKLLSRANLDSSLNLADGSLVGRKVLSTLHDLHASWFQAREFPQTAESDFANEGIREIYDPEQPALYFTRALFDSAVDFTSVMTSNDNLAAKRTNAAPVRVYDNSAWVFSSPVYAEQGELMGMAVTGNISSPYAYVLEDSTPVSGNLQIGEHFGSGFLGSQPYLLANIKAPENFTSDGGILMPRKWGKSVFQDLLCRDLPVIRSGDAASFVDAASTVPFRKSDTCIKCHASMDQLAAGIRGFHYKILAPREAVPPVGGFFAEFAVADLPNVANWPSNPAVGYERQSPVGEIFYRDHLGVLQQVSFLGLSNLGAKFADKDAPYLCLAKRYYEYFTGVSVDVGDIDDLSSLKQLSSVDKVFRAEVITVGMNFKVHKDPIKLIEEIISLPRYGKTNIISNQ